VSTTKRLEALFLGDAMKAFDDFVMWPGECENLRGSRDAAVVFRELSNIEQPSA
jgi:hypothetical protein